MKFIKTFFLAGISFGLLFGVVMSLVFADANAGMYSGVLGGILFGFIISFFVHIQSKAFRKVDSQISDLVYSGSANHFVNAEAVGGWLQLTKTQLIFTPHAINIQKEEFRVDLKDVLSVEINNALGIIPNGLVLTIGDKKEKFVVFGRTTWKNKILEMKG
ncbi:MAG: hypothetical protein RL094_271 [Candidatus Parcubacteria bacterium]|jgi:hypothetical protein